MSRRPRGCGYGVQFAGSWNPLDDCAALPQVQPVESEREERFVLDDGTSHRCSELVALKRWNRAGAIEEVFRVQIGIAQIFVEHAMELIGAGFGSDVNLRAAAAASGG